MIFLIDQQEQTSEQVTRVNTIPCSKRGSLQTPQMEKNRKKNEQNSTTSAKEIK
jgi:hypothetical protein